MDMVTSSPARDWRTGMLGFVDELKEIVSGYPNADLLELGGGRWPSFRLNEMPSNLRSYTVNDISEHELAQLPDGYHKACFDVTGDASAFQGRYDVVFSRFLAEHVRDGRALHRNVLQVLKPGGVAFHLIPTLYAFPFVLNKLLPERLGAAVLKTLLPRRKISPKFPAYYSACRGDSPSMRKLFKNLGYSKVEIHNFFGHFYYEKIPVLRDAQDWFARKAEQNDWSWATTYAYIKAYK